MGIATPLKRLAILGSTGSIGRQTLDIVRSTPGFQVVGLAAGRNHDLLAQRIARALTKARTSGAIPWLRPDGKSQVSVVYENGRPVSVDTVVISTQHSDDGGNVVIVDVLATVRNHGLRL